MIRFYRGFCPAKAVVLWADEVDLVAAIDTVTQHAHMHPNDVALMHAPGELQTRLASLQERKLVG